MASDMRSITKTPIIGSDYAHIEANGFHRITCECGNTLFVWTNRNDCTCHRARCLRCKKAVSYMLELVERAAGMRATLMTVNDSYEEYLAAIQAQDCRISKSVPDIQDDAYHQAYLEAMK